MLQSYLGSGLLLAALVLGTLAALTSLVAARREDPFLAAVGRRAFYAMSALVVLSAVVLEWALVGHDFRLAYVTEHTDRSLSLPLLMAALYGGQEGSLLYWLLCLAAFGSISLALSRLGARIGAWASFSLAAISLFFLLVLNLVASPFSVLAVVPSDGLGLNPVLRDGGMLIHPPFMLAGFSSYAVPFAFAAAALLAGRYDAAWVRYTRKIALIGWGLQSVGLMLGMWWAYHVLGWGGYWGWDPVENVALLPWLAATAYIHSVQVQERRGQLRAWNTFLVVLAFLLSIFGTYIVRSGIVTSVHSFAVSGLGPWFYGFLAILVVFSLALFAWRGGELRSRPLEAAVSREGAFLAQNVIVVAIAAAIFWGTVLPLVSGMFGTPLVVGPAYYERVGVPLFVLFLALLAVGPLLPWRRTKARWLGWLRAPAAATLVTLAALLAFGVRAPGPLIALPLLAAALTGCLVEIWRGGRYARRLTGSWPLAFARLVGRRRRHYGAQLAHIGIILALAGVAGSHFWQTERTVTLSPGQSVEVAGYRLTYSGLSVGRQQDHTVTTAHLASGGAVLSPALVTYPSLGQQALPRVAIQSSPFADLYLVLSRTASGKATLAIFVNPMVTWIWVGMSLMVAGLAFGNLAFQAQEEPARARSRQAVPLAARP